MVTIIDPSAQNPGHREAKLDGCLCPVIDNNHGEYPPVPPSEDHPRGGWVIRGDCPMHG